MINIPKGCYDHKKHRFDLIGKKFGRLTVTEFHHSNNGAFWTCVCDCGNERIVGTHSLTSGHTKSCGCYNQERTRNTQRGRRIGNLYRVNQDVVYVRLTNCNDEFICDLCDLDIVMRETWRKSDTGYAVYNKSKTFHGEVMRPPCGQVVDHINHNKLDNRRCNLRIVPQSTNVQNASDKPRGEVGIRGVYRDKRNGKYIARITMNRETIYIGSYTTLDEAAEARKNKEIELNFGGLYYGNSPSVG